MLDKILQKYLWYASKQVARRSSVHAKISVYVLSLYVLYVLSSLQRGPDIDLRCRTHARPSRRGLREAKPHYVWFQALRRVAGQALTLIPCMAFAHFVPNDRRADLNKYLLTTCTCSCSGQLAVARSCSILSPRAKKSTCKNVKLCCYGNIYEGSTHAHDDADLVCLTMVAMSLKAPFLE